MSRAEQFQFQFHVTEETSMKSRKMSTFLQFGPCLCLKQALTSVLYLHAITIHYMRAQEALRHLLSNRNDVSHKTIFPSAWCNFNLQG